MIYKPPLIDKAHRQQWNEQYPLDYVEHRVAWSPEGEFGAWVLQHNAVIRINDVLFLHGGIGPAYVDMSLREINEQIRAELTTVNFEENRLSEASDGPLWYQGFAQNTEKLESEHLHNVLTTFDVKRIVTGHTQGLGSNPSLNKLAETLSTLENVSPAIK